MAANGVSNESSAHGSSASVIEMMKAIEQIFPSQVNELAGSNIENVNM
jgi:hypothetical protein